MLISRCLTHGGVSASSSHACLEMASSCGSGLKQLETLTPRTIQNKDSTITITCNWLASLLNPCPFDVQ
jgi:hypothetical protein